MLIEKIQSTVLIMLVGLSLYLTYHLWYGQQPSVLLTGDSVERIEVEAPRDLEQIITPTRVIIRADEKIYLLRDSETEYKLLWQLLSEQLGLLSVVLDQSELKEQPINNEAGAGEGGEDLGAVEQNGQEDTAEEDSPGETIKSHLQFFFDPPLPVGLGQPWLPELPYSRVTSVTLESTEGMMWLALERLAGAEPLLISLPPDLGNKFMTLLGSFDLKDKIEYLQLSEELILETLGREIEVRAPIFVPLEDPAIKSIALKPELLDSSILLQTFFVDYNMARIVEERDGSLIYTDGNKGLRLTAHSLEYSHPRIEEGQSTLSYSAALKNCSYLLSFHGGWSPGLRLQSISFTGRGDHSYYSSRWRMFHDGRPMFSAKPTRMLFNDEGLIHYSRSLYFPTDEGGSVYFARRARPWNNALQRALAHIDAQLPGLRPKLRLEEMGTGYAVIKTDSGIRGEPVWHIRINGIEVLMKTSDLEIIPGGELL